MARKYWAASLPLAGSIAVAVALYPQSRNATELEMPEAVTFRILFGARDREPAVWDGNISLSGGKILSIQGWRFRENDRTDYRSSWKASTRPASPQGGRVLENGILVSAPLEESTAAFSVKDIIARSTQ